MIAIPPEEKPNSLAYQGEESWSYSFIKELKEKTNKSEFGLRYEPFSLWKHRPFETNFLKYQKNGYRNTINAKLNENVFLLKRFIFMEGAL